VELIILLLVLQAAEAAAKDWAVIFGGVAGTISAILTLWVKGRQSRTDRKVNEIKIVLEERRKMTEELRKEVVELKTRLKRYESPTE
jgi:hypothetical protein